jgi:hypothetical protein
MDFWTLPKPKEEKKNEPDLSPEKLEKMSNEDFIALGEEKIDAFLKASGAPANVKASMILNSVKNGMMTTKRMADMLRQMPKPKSKEGADPVQKALLAFSDKEMNGKGYINWQSFQHPSLGQIEIGGMVPFATNTPPSHMISRLLNGQIPWIFQLSEKIARIKIGKTNVTALGKGLYRLKIWIENRGYLPFPTEMGKRNSRIPPIAVTLEGNDLDTIEGKKRELIKEIPGNGSQAVTWIVHLKTPGRVIIEAKSTNAGADSVSLDLGGSQ